MRPFRRKPAIRTVLRPFAALSCSIAASAMGQSVLSPLPSVPGESIPPPAANPAAAGITTGAATPAEYIPEGPVAALPGTVAQEFWTWGETHVKTHLTYQLLYGTGIQSSPGQSQNTITHTVNPGVAITLGQHWVLDYEPSLTFFSDSHFHNTFDQSATLSGGTTYGNWSFGLSQNYTRADQPTVETASQTGIQSYTAGLSAVYHFGSKWSLETGGGVALMFVDQNQIKFKFIIETNGVREAFTTNSALSDTQTYFGSEWVNYEVNPKVSLAGGVTGGYSDQSSGLTTANEQFLGRIVLHPGAKLALSADGGVEDSRYLNSNQSDLWTPTFAASATYHLFEPTTFILSANRSVDASLFQNQLVEKTGVGLGLQQRLFGKLQLTLGYSHAISDYLGSMSVLSRREDTGDSYQAGLSFAFLKHGSIGTFYEYGQNSSNEGAFGYSSHQAGLTLTWAY